MLVSDFTDHVPGWRIIATPDALDAAPWPEGAQVVRISPDDAYVIGIAEPSVPGDPHAIVTPEFGFSVATVLDLEGLAEQHIEWVIPVERPAMVQGQIAGVPAKLVLHEDGITQLLVACAARHELQGRLA